MTFKPHIWRPISIGLAAVNFLGMAMAAGSSEPTHATVHAALALAFAYWAQRLRPATGALEQEDRIDMLEAEIGNLRGELSDAAERLDFAERMLAQAAETRRVNPEHPQT
jgi:hypothetical protein